MHKKGEKFTDFNEIRMEIERVTASKVAQRTGVSSEEINLHIHSPNVLDLILIDLPGLVAIPVGDAPLDIKEQIEKMVLNYITKPNCLILSVTQANVSFATNNALTLVRKIDPVGDRTIGVITKLDLMDKGENARKVLENKTFPLRRGYVGVVNRSQKDIDDKKPIADALKYEHEFFRENYPEIAYRMGTPHLKRMLNQELTEHIREKLPNLESELKKKLALIEKEIEEYNLIHNDNMKDMLNRMIG